MIVGGNAMVPFQCDYDFVISSKEQQTLRFILPNSQRVGYTFQGQGSSNVDNSGTRAVPYFSCACPPKTIKLDINNLFISAIREQIRVSSRQV